MAASEAIETFGVILKKETAPGAGTYTDWGLELTDLTPPGIQRQSYDATHHQSPGAWGEVIISAVKRLQPFPIEFNWIPSDTPDVIAALEDGVSNWKIEIPDGSSVIVAAGMTEVTFGAMPVEGKASASATFTPSGQPTWA